MLPCSLEFRPGTKAYIKEGAGITQVINEEVYSEAPFFVLQDLLLLSALLSPDSVTQFCGSALGKS